MSLPKSTSADVAHFLAAFRTCVEFGGPDRVVIRNTPKNIQSQLDLGFTKHSTIQYLNLLTPQNYCAGPEPDLDEDKKEVWKFGAKIEGIEIYIKIRLDPAKPFDRPVIRSFHPAERPLAYPHRKGNT